MDILNLTPIIIKNIVMDTYCFKKVKSSSILILIERDDGQKKQIVEMPTNGSCV